MLRGNAGKALRGHDFNASPPEAIWGLLGVEGRKIADASIVWEPACGDGAIVLPLRSLQPFGPKVFASDLIERACPHSWVEDFLGTDPKAYPNCDMVITNPPFSLAQEFVDHGLAVAPVVMMLLRLAFLEADGRNEWLQRSPLSTVHVFVDRLPMMHREGYTGKRLKKSSTAYAWFVWDQRQGAPRRRFDWITATDVAVGRRLCGS